jgi:surface carbohydrate biosynthesis protein (TIGR04326 family)
MSDLHIWDVKGLPPLGDWTSILWRSFSRDASTSSVSIPQLIEDKAEVYRSRYLTWVYEFGESYIEGGRLVDYLQVRPVFSYWWMTLLTEKCNYSKSPQINDAIRLMAFEDWLVGRVITRITLSSSNNQLASCLAGWCHKSGVAFEWQRKPKSMKAISRARCFYTALPSFLQACLWLLRYLYERWPLRGVGVDEWSRSEGHHTFIGYSDNCVPEAVQRGQYKSLYWAHLPELLKQQSCKVNFLHLYVKDSLLLGSKQAANVLEAFNRNADGAQYHVTLDSFLSLKIFFRTLRDLLRVRRIWEKIDIELIQANNHLFSFWPLFREDWQNSMLGPVAVANLLHLNLFETALEALPKQKNGVYLQENQSWESALIHVWKAKGHGNLIGTPHSTIRFWDLRYFFDPQCYERLGCNDLPIPDLVACNGPAALYAYEQGGYPNKKLVEVEALRYLHLEVRERKDKSTHTKPYDEIRLLVMGEYLPETTNLQMKLLEQALPLLPKLHSTIVKPHPNCPINPDDYPTLHLQVSVEPISKLLAECDVAYASAVTSAAVDAYCLDVPLITLLDSNTLNLSPLRGCDDVLFVSTPEELACGLMAAASQHSDSRKKKSPFFLVGMQLQNWQTLLLA